MTDRPVVVQPLTASKSAFRVGSCFPRIKGTAPISGPQAHAKSTVRLDLPICERQLDDASASRFPNIHISNPKTTEIIPGIRNEAANSVSFGYHGRTIRGAATNNPIKTDSFPILELSDQYFFIFCYLPVSA